MNATKPPVNSQQLLQVLLLEGQDAFVAALEKHQPTLPVLKKLHAALLAAVESPGPLHGAQQYVHVVEDHMQGRGLTPYAERGRAPPTAGERRQYRVQQLEGMGPYVRLPVSSLPLKKGDVVVAHFVEGEIKIAPALRGAGAADGE